MISKLKSWGFVSVAGFSRYTGKTASKHHSILVSFEKRSERLRTRHSRGGILFVVSLVCSPHAGRALPLDRTKGSKVRQRAAGPCRAKALRLLLLPRPVRSENRFKSPLRSVKRFLPPDTRGRHTLAPTHGRKYRYRRLANTGIPLPPSRRNRYSVARIR